jgi:choline kinase
MVFSLLQAKDYLFSGTQTIIAYSDLVYEPHLIQSLIDVPSDIATVIDENWLDLWSARFDDPLCDAETLKLNEDGTLKEIGQKPSSLKEINGQFVGLTKLNQAGARRFVECWDAVRNKTAPQFGNRTADMCYLTDILQRLVDMGESVRSVPVKSGWLEIDSPTDLTVYNDWLENGRLKSFFRTEWSKQ